MNNAMVPMSHPNQMMMPPPQQSPQMMMAPPGQQPQPMHAAQPVAMGNNIANQVMGAITMKQGNMGTIWPTMNGNFPIATGFGVFTGMNRNNQMQVHVDSFLRYQFPEGQGFYTGIPEVSEQYRPFSFPGFIGGMF